MRQVGRREPPSTTTTTTMKEKKKKSNARREMHRNNQRDWKKSKKREAIVTPPDEKKRDSARHSRKDADDEIIVFPSYRGILFFSLPRMKHSEIFFFRETRELPEASTIFGFCWRCFRNIISLFRFQVARLSRVTISARIHFTSCYFLIPSFCDKCKCNSRVIPIASH